MQLEVFAILNQNARVGCTLIMKHIETFRLRIPRRSCGLLRAPETFLLPTSQAVSGAFVTIPLAFSAGSSLVMIIAADDSRTGKACVQAVGLLHTGIITLVSIVMWSSGCADACGAPKRHPHLANHLNRA